MTPSEEALFAEFPDDMTIGEARAILREKAKGKDGAECPVCRQRVKVYDRPIHASMASGLIRAYRLASTGFAYLPDVLTHRQNADFAKLAYWGLIEKEEGRREDGSTRIGRWRVTELGEDWVLLRAKVLSHARCYNKRCMRLLGEPVTIKDCLGKKFDYDDLMRGIE